MGTARHRPRARGAWTAAQQTGPVTRTGRVGHPAMTVCQQVSKNNTLFFWNLPSIQFSGESIEKSRNIKLNTLNTVLSYTEGKIVIGSQIHLMKIWNRINNY